MAFWSYHGGAAMTSTIDTILEKDEVSLEELLADDELLQECKALNSRLLEYLCTPTVLAKLFAYITVEPTDQDSSDRRYTCVSCFAPTRAPQRRRDVVDR